MRKRNIVPIMSAPDAEKIQPILEALFARGAKKSARKTPGKGDVVVLFLSENFAADEAVQESFFAADSAGREIIPVDLDGAAQSELVKSAVIAKNAIAAAGRTPEEIAERIVSAEAFREKKSPLPKILIAAAVVLALGAGLWLLRSRMPEKPEEEAAATPALAQSEIAAAQKFGLTAEDLARITSFCIVGDVHGTTSVRFTTDSSINPGLRVFLSDLAYDSEEMDGRHWYSTEDGHEFTLTHYDDLSVIELMPNLRSLTLVLVETDKLPSLVGLNALEELRLENCRLGDLEWAADASFLQFTCRGCDIEDFSPLGSCVRLREAEFELDGVTRADFSAVGTPSLHNVVIRGGEQLREIDLTGLRKAQLWELRLTRVPVKDLDFLSWGQDSLSQLELDDLDALRSIEPVRSLSSLTWVDLKNLRNVNDLTPLGRCGRIKEFHMENMRQIRDLDFLIGCASLQRVSLGNCDIEDLDFVATMSKNFGTELEIYGNVRDWSGLSNNSFYGSLTISPDSRRVADILPYLENCSVGNLRIGNAADLDLSALPKVSSRLSLWNCPNIEDLTGLKDTNSFSHLELQDMPRLRSLNGLQKIRAFGRNEALFNCELWVDNCPRLDDWSALNGAKFGNIRLKRVYTLPEFGKMLYYQYTVLRLESIPDIEDLSFLDEIKNPEKIYFSFELVDLENLKSLDALRRFRGEFIAVMPELQDQAQALVEAKRFGRLDIAYPSGGWNGGGYDDFILLSLEELDTLSDKALAHVTSICLAGDQLVDSQQYEVWDEWDGRRHHVLIVDRNTGEQTEVKTGGMSDLSALAKLTGLRRLELFALPITSLDGIQIMSELEELRIQNCPNLRDASAAFTLQGLRRVEIGRCPITSIQGVQNLMELSSLAIYETKVKDLSPLRDVDYSVSVRNGGFDMSIGGTNCDDYSPLEAVPVFSYLDLNGVDAARWPDLSQVEALRRLSAHGDNLTQAKLEELLASHPELAELQIPHNEKITDLTPLLGMENLQRVLISRDMKKAVASLDGQDLPFELEIWD